LLKYDIDELNKLLLDIYRITGYTISLWDTQFNQLAFQPHPMPTFCALIKASPEGKRRCEESDSAVLKKCIETRSMHWHICHAGLVDCALPLMNDNELIGGIMFGQLVPQGNSENDIIKILKNVEVLHIDNETIKNEYKKLKPFELDVAKATAMLISRCVAFMQSSRIIRHVSTELSSQIEQFIDDNLSSRIDSKTLCNRFFISESTLRKVFSKYFPCPLVEYINKKRVNKAKMLLQSGRTKISEVAVSVGIPDQNYFAKVFKKYTGCSPNKYKAKK